MKTEHKYAQMWRWLADGETIIGSFKGSTESIFPENFSSASLAHAAAGEDGWEFRLKPRTITVNGREVQAGESEWPENRSEYWFPSFHQSEMVDSARWDTADEMDRQLFERGLVHLTKEAAIAHAKAMLNID